MDQLVADVMATEVLGEMNAQLLGAPTEDSSNKLHKRKTDSKFMVAEQKTTSLNSKAHKSKEKLQEKVFVARRSLIVELLEMPHIRPISHMCIAFMLILFLNNFLHDLVVYGTFNIGINIIITCFGKFDIALCVWAVLQLATLLVYPAFKLWAKGRHHYVASKQMAALKIWNYVWLSNYVLYLIAIHYFATKSRNYYKLGPASAIALLMEAVRLSMKAHAFIRTNGGRVTANGSTFTAPDFQKYIYFLFAPTLIYRDEYPRNKEIKWGIAGHHLLELIGTILFLGSLFEGIFLKFFLNFGAVPVQPGSLIVSIFGCMVPGFMFQMLGFYCLLHSWLNFTAELLRFADRRFYDAWWTCFTYREYYRKWNIVVQDWLYVYVYKDVYDHLANGSKIVSTVATITISAVVHEYLLAITFGYFYPVLFVLFNIIGLMLMFVSVKHKNLGNIFLLFGLGMGYGITISLFSMESFARINCEYRDDVWGYFIPVSWTCNGIVWNNVSN